MDKNDVEIDITMSNDRTVFSFVFSADEAITNRVLSEVFEEHARVLREVDMQLEVINAGT